jgi:hypothetical protein
MSRAGTWLIGMGGLILAALMAYTLTLGVGGAPPRIRGAVRSEASEVAVVFPERVYWVEFRQGVLACVRRKLARLIEEGDDALLVETPRQRRRIRFGFHEARGLRETRDEVRQLAGRPDAPIALVGSSNTVLTAALAETLRTPSGADGRPGPVLLIPWATSVLVGRPEAGAGPVALLDIDPGRTFRFCPNNQRLADLVVRCLADHDAGVTLERAYIIEDRHDPYSLDLADCFRRVIEQVAPDAELIDHADTLAYTGIADPNEPPSSSEEALAERIWRNAANAPDRRTTWVVLPLQEQPADRILRALSRHRRAGDGPLRVICGEAIGLKTLARWAGRVPFPIWCVSFDALPDPEARKSSDAEQALPTDVQVPAEIVSALVRCLDRPAGQPLSADVLRDALDALAIDPHDPSALGRSIAFDDTGERQGDDLGHVLLIEPDRHEVLALSRGESGRWGAPIPVRPVPAPDHVPAAAEARP